MSITIRSMIDSPRRRAALQSPNHHARTPFRLIPRWNLAPGLQAHASLDKTQSVLRIGRFRPKMRR